MTDEEDYEACPSGLCFEEVECSCYDEDSEDCWYCDGTGYRVPDHCCACGGSPYCACCRKCGAACVGECKCPIPTERDGKVVTV